MENGAATERTEVNRSTAVKKNERINQLLKVQLATRSFVAFTCATFFIKR